MNNDLNLYPHFFHQNNTAFLIIRQKKIIDCNEKLLELFNYKSKKDIINQFYQILFPEKQPNGISSVVEFHKLLNNACNDTYNFICMKNGSIWFDAELSISKYTINYNDYHFISIKNLTDIKINTLSSKLEQFKKYLDPSNDYYVSLDNSGNIKYISQSLGFLLADDIESLLGKNWLELMHNSNPKLQLKNTIINKLITNYKSNSQEIYTQSLITKSGNKRKILWSDSVLKDAHGNITGKLISGNDITDDLHIYKQLMEIEINFQQLMKNINETFWVIKDNCIDTIFVSSAFEYIFEKKWDYDIGINNFYSSIHPDDLSHLKSSFKKLIETGSTFHIEYRIIKPDNSIKWISSKAFPIINIDNKVIRIVGLAEDITPHKQLQNSLYKMATTDYLTGCYNRQHFLKTADDFIDHAIFTKDVVSLLMIDIDNFKEVNYTYGHSIGDQILQELVKTCTNLLGEKDLFGRIGGEEFAIILTGYNKDDAFIIAENIRKEVENLTLEIEGYTIKITISIGISVFSNTVCDSNYISDLLNCADKALYQAKNSGNNKTVFY